MIVKFYDVFVVSSILSIFGILLGFRFIYKAFDTKFKDETAYYAQIIYIIGLISYYFCVIFFEMYLLCVSMGIRDWKPSIFVVILWLFMGVTLVNMLFNMYSRIAVIFIGTVFELTKKSKTRFLVFISIIVIMVALDVVIQLLSEITNYESEIYFIFTVLSHCFHMITYISYIILVLVMLYLFIKKLYRMNREVSGNVDIPKLVRKYIILFMWQCVSTIMVVIASIYVTLHGLTNSSFLFVAFTAYMDYIINMSAIYLQYNVSVNDYYICCGVCDRLLYKCMEHKKDSKNEPTIIIT